MTRRHTLVRLCLLALLAEGSLLPIWAQRVGIKTNALGWLGASPNLGVELRPSRHFTLNFEMMGSPLKVGNFRTQHLTFIPEVRYWFTARPQAGHFLGFNALASTYHFSWNNMNHHGDALGAGVTYGYSWVLSRRWSLETTAGVGLLHQRDKNYTNGVADSSYPHNGKTRPFPTKLGISFVYILK